MKLLMDQFGDVQPFLEEASVSPATIEKHILFLRNPQEKKLL